jgi:hypothetical protein
LKVEEIELTADSSQLTAIAQSEAKSSFIAQKARDGAEFLVSLGMTGGLVFWDTGAIRV